MVSYNLVSIGSGDVWHHQANTGTSVDLLLTESLGTVFIEIPIQIHKFSVKNMYLKMSSSKWQPFCAGLNVFGHLLESMKSTCLP